MKRFLFAAILVASLCLGGTAEAKHPRVKYIQPRFGAYNGVTYVNPSFRAPSFGVYRGIPYSVPGYYGGYRGGGVRLAPREVAQAGEDAGG